MKAKMQKVWKGHIQCPTGWLVLGKESLRTQDNKYILITEAEKGPVIKITAPFDKGSNIGGGQKAIVNKEASRRLKEVGFSFEPGSYALAQCGGNPPIDFAPNQSVKNVLLVAEKDEQIITYSL